MSAGVNRCVVSVPTGTLDESALCRPRSVLEMCGQPTFRTTSSTARRHPAASSSVLRKLHSAETASVAAANFPISSGKV